MGRTGLHMCERAAERAAQEPARRCVPHTLAAAGLAVCCVSCAAVVVRRISRACRSLRTTLSYGFIGGGGYFIVRRGGPQRCGEDHNAVPWSPPLWTPLGPF